MTAEAIARMERELPRLQEAISSIQDSYGQDHLHLTVPKGYLRKLVTSDRVARYSHDCTCGALDISKAIESIMHRRQSIRRVT
jgi:hypothetical protein